MFLRWRHFYTFWWLESSYGSTKHRITEAPKPWWTRPRSRASAKLWPSGEWRMGRMGLGRHSSITELAFEIGEDVYCVYIYIRIHIYIYMYMYSNIYQAMIVVLGWRMKEICMDVYKFMFLARCLSFELLNDNGDGAVVTVVASLTSRT